VIRSEQFRSNLLRIVGPECKVMLSLAAHSWQGGQRIPAAWQPLERPDQFACNAFCECGMIS
jgi:hypothetical protein